MKREEIIYKGVILFIIVLYVVLSFPSFSPFPQVTTALSSIFLNSVGYTSTSYNNFLLIDGFNPIQVSFECSGILLLLAFVLTIQLVPIMSLYHKFLSLLLIPIIFLGNLIRIIIGVFIGLYVSIDALTFYHNTISQIFIFAWTIGVYIAWLKFCRMFPKDQFTEKLRKDAEK